MKVLSLRNFLLYIAFLMLVLVLGMEKSTSVMAATSPATGASGSMRFVVKGGELSFAVGTPSSVVSTPLNNSQQNVSYTIPVTVTDATGSGDGWTLRLQNNDATTSQSTGTLNVTGLVARCAVDSTCSLPENTVSYSNPIAIGADANPIVTASRNTGMGMIALDVTVSAVVPVGYTLNAYSGALAFALSSGQTL